jgi:hypothetical protein
LVLLLSRRRQKPDKCGFAEAWNPDSGSKEAHRSRREFVKRYFAAEMEDRVHYDIVLNTEPLGFEDAASIVVPAHPFKDRTASVR